MRQFHFNVSPIIHFVSFAKTTMYMPGMGIAAAVSMRAGQGENRQI